MIKYFNEIDEKDNYKVYITHNNRFNSVNREVKLDFYQKYYEVFRYINEINRVDELRLLMETCKITDLKEKCLRQLEIIQLINNRYQTNEDKLYNLIINRRYDKTMGLLNKIENLESRDLNDIFTLYYYLIDIINPFNDKSILETIKMALKDLNEIDNKAIYGKTIETIILPNYWYILPDFHELDSRLYNTTGDIGHKEANLIYPYCMALKGKILNPKDFIDKVKDIELNGVSISDYANYVGYGMAYLPNPLDNIDGKSHMQNNINVTAGSVMAQGILWDYFMNLNTFSKNYKASLEVFKKIVLDDFLIRIIGFHKVIMRGDNRIISTSSLDYKDDFTEYVHNGWNIDFIPPLKYDYDNNKIKEEDSDFILLKQFHTN